jgi:prevent-host-death family protein
MDTISVSKFKATCLAVLERVRRTGQPILVTKFGKPIAEVVPPAPATTERKLGFMRGALGVAVEADWSGIGGDEETARQWDELNRPAKPTNKPRAKRT